MPMTSSKMYKLVNQFNEKEPKELELIYRPWEKPEDRIFIEPADFAANKFMVGNKGIYCRTVYAPGFTDEQVLEALVEGKFEFYKKFCDMYTECIIDTDGEG